MKKTIKVWIIIALILLVSGGALFAFTIHNNNYDFSVFETTSYITNTHEISEDFSKISIIADTADIFFVPSEDSLCRVVCFESETAPHSVSVGNDTLFITADKEKQNIKNIITFSFNQPKVTVFLPKEVYGTVFVKSSTSDVYLPNKLSFESITINGTTGDIECNSSVTDFINIELTTGDVSLENISANNIDVTTSTGDIESDNLTCKDFSLASTTGDVEIENVKCENLNSSATTGDITVENCIALGNFSIVRDTGDVTLKNSDAAEIYIKTTTGDVRGSINTPKIFITKTDTGSTDVPASVTGGKCEITTDTGDIKIIVL